MIKELTFMDAKLGILFDICKQNPKKMITFAPMITENPYVKQFPDLMAGKTLLYCHGFGSSGQSGTVTRLRTVMPQTNVIAPDLPVDPHEAIALLHSICQQEKPDLIIGTSMGGMYAEQLRGFDRICINPALEIAETMKAHGMTGTQQFQNPRQDGVQEFYVDKALVKAYREVSEQRFEGLTPEDEQRVIGLFGDQGNHLYRTGDHEKCPRPAYLVGTEGRTRTDRALRGVLRCATRRPCRHSIMARRIY